MALLETLLGVGAVVLVLIIILLIASYIFWLMMFIDALKKRDTLWILLFIFCFLTGFLSGLIATIYWFVEYRN